MKKETQNKKRINPMTCNPAKHHRRSIRLQGYDYSSPGYYFITLCIHDRWLRMFGNIDNRKMTYSDCGTIANEWMEKLPERFADVTVDSYVIMPNHVHLILHIVAESSATPGGPISVRAIHELPRRGLTPRGTDNETYRKKRRVMTIPKIIGYYRMNTAKHINIIRKTSGNPVWQRNYWEHIIRDENEYLRIFQYIKNNPSNWKNDTLNGGTGNRVLEPIGAIHPVGAIHELPLRDELPLVPYGDDSWTI